MQIDDVRIRLIHKEGCLKAIASMTIDGCFVIHDIKVLEKNGERFIGMPTRKLAEGTFADIAHPIDQETRNAIQKAILERYDQVSQEKAATI